MLNLAGVEKSYAKGSVKAVDRLSLEVRRGEIFGFIGPNGAGKTTTIKMITGILSPDQGDIFVDGVNLAKEPVRAKGKIGYVPDDHNIYDRVKGIEYLQFIGDIYGVPAAERKAAISKYLTLFGLGQAANDLVKTYSHGMKQKLVIAGALLHKPPLWILDEPLTGLDPKSALTLKEEMRSHCREGNTVFFSTHVLEVAEKLCDRVGIIDGGKLAAVGSIDELRRKAFGSGGEDQKDDSLESLFFKITGDAEEKGE